MTGKGKVICGMFLLALTPTGCGGGGGGGAPAYSPQATSNQTLVAQGSVSFTLPARGIGRSASLIPAQAAAIDATVSLVQRKPGLPVASAASMTRRVPLTAATQTVTFGGLDGGTWRVEMAALDSNGQVTTQMTNIFAVTPGVQTEVPLTLGYVYHAASAAPGGSSVKTSFPEGAMLTFRAAGGGGAVSGGGALLPCSMQLGDMGSLACPVLGDQWLLIIDNITLASGSVLPADAVPANRGPGLGIVRGLLSPLQLADAAVFELTGSVSLDWGDGQRDISEPGKLLHHRYFKPGFYLLTASRADLSNGPKTYGSITILDLDPSGILLYARTGESITLTDKEFPGAGGLTISLEGAATGLVVKLENAKAGTGVALINTSNDLTGAASVLCPLVELKTEVRLAKVGQRFCLRHPTGGAVMELGSLDFFSAAGSAASAEAGFKAVMKLAALDQSAQGGPSP